MNAIRCHVFRGQSEDGQPVVVSCFKMTAEELAEVNKTGRVWLIVYGHTMPPVILDGESPFQ